MTHTLPKIREQPYAIFFSEKNFKILLERTCSAWKIVRQFLELGEEVSHASCTRESCESELIARVIHGTVIGLVDIVHRERYGDVLLCPTVSVSRFRGLRTSAVGQSEKDISCKRNRQVSTTLWFGISLIVNLKHMKKLYEEWGAPSVWWIH